MFDRLDSRVVRLRDEPVEVDSQKFVAVSPQ
jgi:hypothetical protein